MALPYEIAEIHTESGVFYAEVAVPRGGDIGAGERLVTEWTSIKAQVAEVSRHVVEMVQESLPVPPDKYEVEFGIKISAETGPVLGMLAKAGGEASVLVRLTWENGK